MASFIGEILETLECLRSHKLERQLTMKYLQLHTKVSCRNALKAFGVVWKVFHLGSSDCLRITVFKPLNNFLSSEIKISSIHRGCG